MTEAYRYGVQKETWDAIKGLSDTIKTIQSQEAKLWKRRQEIYNEKDNLSRELHGLERRIYHNKFDVHKMLAAIDELMRY